METLLQLFGSAVVGVLRADPYQLIRHVKGYGFKKVDSIARAMGVPKDHPGRIKAGILYVASEELSSGHTWTAGADLLNLANDVLLQDTLDSRDVIRASADDLLRDGQLVAVGNAVMTPQCLETEQFIQSVFDRHGWQERPLSGIQPQLTGLKEKQAAAYQAALRFGIAVISGGAGTGKTYVLARLAKTFQQAGLRLALCSPTGKAAKRIEESLRCQGLDLEAKTIHRLLEYDGQRFQRESLSWHRQDGDDADSADSDSWYDVVIVDEVSMVDVPLMSELLRRIDFTRTRLILVGDHNQLPPVGPGNVLRDIIQHNLVPTVVLDEVVRQASILKSNSTAVLSGVIAPTAVNDPAWTVVDAFQDPQQIQVYLRELVLQKIPNRLKVDPIDDGQVITPTHIGPLGTKAINQMMQRLLHGNVERKFAVGDKVIQTVNDYEMGVMNGTLGRVMECHSSPDGGYEIKFDSCGVRQVKGEQVQNVQLAYALTAHKAQGSEFPCAVVLCHKSHYFADRNWLYTAVTRASRYCILIGDRWGLRNAVKKNNTIWRRTFLSLWSKDASGCDASPLEARP
jgi:exodeoxyribonuclease V alpha subunit